MTDGSADLNRVLDHALSLHRQWTLDEASMLYVRVLAAQPGNFTARHMLGVLHAQQGRGEDALKEIETALAIRPDDAPALIHHGNVLGMLGRPSEALISYDRALALQPNDADAWVSRGNVLRALQQQEKALGSHARALAITPGHVEALYQSGNLQWGLGRGTDALDSFARVLALAPNHAGALNNRGAVQWELGQTGKALESYAQALRAQPDFVPALNNYGNALLALRRFDDALASYKRSLAVMPDQTGAAVSRAGLLLRLKRPAEALAAYHAILARNPAERHALGGAFTASLHLCDWDETARLMPLLRKGLESGSAVVPPFMLLGASGDKALQLSAAECAYADTVAEVLAPLWTGERYDHQRIRLAYLSSDYGQHPVPTLIARLIELHDRNNFEVIGFSTGLDDGSDTRARIVRAFDSFHDLQGHSPQAVAQRLRQCEIDILVELNGHTDGDHFRVLVHRPCPVQVNYLGYPGTDGAEVLDYILADPVVAPFADQSFFREKIVHLPNCYFPTNYVAVAPPPTRAQETLPAQGFVFCSFNNSWKFTRAMFEIWMRLLIAVPGSVLWLLQSNTEFRDRLAREAEKRGIDPWRLIYAPRTTPAQHLARQQLADLMLDTLPYNGHMTSSDALWAGVPLVTVRGEAFAGRVAASLLNAMDMGELVTNDLQGYEALALELARNPARLQGLRKKMATNRDTTALFDIPRLCENIERAYATMHAIREAGEAPRSFAVG